MKAKSIVVFCISNTIFVILVISESLAIGCPRHHIFIIVKRSSLGDVRREDISLNDPSCIAKALNSTHFILDTSLDKCGTKSYRTKNAFVYENTVRERYHGLISRVNEIRIPFKCFYATMGSTSAVYLNATRKRIGFNASSTKGDMKLGISVFKDVGYNLPYSDQDFPIGVMVSQRVFFQLNVESPDKRLTVAAHRCHATPDQNANNEIFYNIIADG